MGEVYRARDTRLDRTVAVKVLPPHVLDDPGVRARFEREARAASSLDHPNICALYDVGREGGVEYLVMQHLDGETLADRLARGPLPLAEALRIGADIAAALDQAHRAGILHRDVKPGNVMLTKGSGRESATKLLDFGLAKSVSPRGAGVPEISAATVTSPLTGQGTIVGTLQYMSPEQLEGGDVDARSDIFSFGAVLYEMVTGRRAFEGGSQASIISGILERDPPPLTAAAPLTPPALDRVVRKCLAKPRERRWQSAADLGDELTWIAQASTTSGAVAAAAVTAVPRRGGRALLIATGMAIVTLGAALTWSLTRPRTSRGEVLAPRSLALEVPDGIAALHGGLAVSPDGRTVVFAGGKPARLYLRRFDAPGATLIPGTAGARTPFFSPDGESIGYLTNTALMKVGVRAGPPVRIVGLPPVNRGGAWLADDTMVIAPTQTSGLQRVTAGGEVSTLTVPNAAAGEQAHLWPSVLPGGQDVVFTIRRGTTTDVDNSDIAVLQASSGEYHVIVKGGAFPRYSSTGHLLFVRGGTLFAIRFDPSIRQTSGTAVPVAQGIAVDSWVGGAHYAVAPDGTLLFLRGTFPGEHRTAVWVDRSGGVVPAAGISGVQLHEPRISPDGTRALFSTPSPEGDNEIYVVDLRRGTAVRISNDPEDDFAPIWSTDGRSAIWTAFPTGRLPFLVKRAADGTGPMEPLLPHDAPAQFPGSVSRSGVLAYTQQLPSGNPDIYVMALDGDRKPRPFVNTPAPEISAEFSPDGKWIAYVSRESGGADIYVVPYPGPGATRRVTSGGGVSPAWSRDGRELFYQWGDALMSVPVNVAADISFGVPRRVASGPFAIDTREDSSRAYDVSPDGRRFLMLKVDTPAVPLPSFHVLLNWAANVTR
jgi:Tol biopolymer transport system component